MTQQTDKQKTSDAPSRDKVQEQKPPRTSPLPVRHASPPHLATRRAPSQFERRAITTRDVTVKIGSYNAEERSFEAVVATETPARVFNWYRGEEVEEILVHEGGEFPAQCPLLDSHNRWKSSDVIGSARKFWAEDRQWIGRSFFVEGDPEVDRIANRVRQKHITDVSIGYEVLSYVDIPARTTQEINGRRYTAGERTLRVTTRWVVRELSVTPIGADQKAKIRSQLGGEVLPAVDRQPAAPFSRRSCSMNPRLLAYLRSLMHNPNATEEECRTYMAALSGSERTIAYMLDYDLTDVAARTTVDQALRSMGCDPANPASPLGMRSLPRRERQAEEDEERADLEDEEREDCEEEERTDEETEETPPKRKKRKRSQPSLAQIRADARRDERERVAQLREMAGSLVPAAVLNRAIDSGWSVERAGVAFMQAVNDSRGEPLGADLPAGGGAPAGHSRNSASDYHREALVAALMMRGSTISGRRTGIDDPVRRRYEFNPETGSMRFVDASKDDAWCRAVDRGYELRALSQVEIARRILEQGGIRVEPIAQHVTRAFARAGVATTQAYVGIYTQTFGALLLDSFLGTKDSTAGWTIERDNPNFLQNERHRITKGGRFTKHAKGGEAEHFGLADATEYTRIFRYSAQTGIDEIDMINDTMFNAQRGATPEEMGESARRLRPDLAYAILLSNPNLADGAALFNSTYGNIVFSGAMTKAKLQAALTVVRTRQENGVNLDLEAKYVITPQAMSYDCRELIRSATVVVAGVTDTIRGAENALKDDALVPIADSRLDNGVTDPDTGTVYAGDVDDYYVAAPPSRHTIEITYLRGGGRVPEIRSGMFNEPGKWGIWFDAKHDLGGKALARAGLCKVTSAAS